MFPEQPSESGLSDVETPRPPIVSAAPRPTQRRAIAASLVAVALFGGLVGFAADRWATTNFNGGQPAVAAQAPSSGSGPRIGPVAAPDGGARVAQAADPQATADPSQQ